MIPLTLIIAVLASSGSENTSATIRRSNSEDVAPPSICAGGAILLESRHQIIFDDPLLKHTVSAAKESTFYLARLDPTIGG